jgi:hypothetical protein
VRGRKDASEDLESGSTKSDPVEDKYHKLYEDSVNPFVLFNKKVLLHEAPNNTTTEQHAPNCYCLTDDPLVITNRTVVCCTGEIRSLQRPVHGREDDVAHGRLLLGSQVLAHLCVCLHDRVAHLCVLRHVSNGQHFELQIDTHQCSLDTNNSDAQ